MTAPHKWERALDFPTLDMNPPIYTYRCVVCGALGKGHGITVFGDGTMRTLPAVKPDPGSCPGPTVGGDS